MLNGVQTRGSLPLDAALRTAFWVAAAGAVVLYAAASRAALFGWLAGAGWNLLNIKLLQQLAPLLGGELKNSRRRLTLLLLAKFGLLYPAAVLLLWAGLVPLKPFAAGFTAVLAAVAVSVAAARPWKEAHV